MGLDAWTLRVCGLATGLKALWFRSLQHLFLDVIVFAYCIFDAFCLLSWLLGFMIPALPFFLPKLHFYLLRLLHASPTHPQYQPCVHFILQLALHFRSPREARERLRSNIPWHSGYYCRKPMTRCNPKPFRV